MPSRCLAAIIFFFSNKESRLKCIFVVYNALCWIMTTYGLVGGDQRFDIQNTEATGSSETAVTVMMGTTLMQRDEVELIVTAFHLSLSSLAVRLPLLDLAIVGYSRVRV